MQTAGGIIQKSFTTEPAFIFLTPLLTTVFLRNYETLHQILQVFRKRITNINDLQFKTDNIMQDSPKQCDGGKAIRLTGSLIVHIAYRVSIFRPLSILCFFFFLWLYIPYSRR
jgi:hypothetical protein